MSRFKAFSIHFGISFIIFLILLYFILIQWYPQPFFSTDGGWRVLRIIIGVDLVLGPLLTLIVFKSGKPGLKFDLTMIAIVQAIALSWGVWNSYNERPAVVIYAIDSFTPVPAYQLKENGIGTKELKKFGDSWPILIYSDIPKNQLSEILSKSMREGVPLYLQKDLYQPFDKSRAEILKANSMNLEKYVEDKPELKKLYQRALLKNAAKTNIAYLGLHSRDKWITVVFDLDEMKIIDSIGIEPSKYLSAQKIKQKKKVESEQK